MTHEAVTNLYFSAQVTTLFQKLTSFYYSRPNNDILNDTFTDCKYTTVSYTEELLDSNLQMQVSMSRWSPALFANIKIRIISATISAAKAKTKKAVK